MDSSDEAQLESLEKQNKENEDYSEKEKERIERLEESGAISKEQADARKQVVDDNTATREAQLEQQKKQIQKRQAEREKLISLGQVAINTASAIMKNTAQLGYLPAIPVNILTGVLGAIQAGTILAQRIPEYAKGTDSHPGGFALLGDGGRHEMIITPDNKMFMSPKTPTVMNLPKDTIVLPDYGEALLRMSMNILPKERTDGITIFESVKQLEEIKGLKGNVARMNRSNNMGNEAIQRELIQINRRLGRQSLDNSINRRKMNN
jgi:uncharacterized membrane protein YeaQ/YmgE (transglycosylase-associated protein family)